MKKKRGYFGIGVYHPKTKENIGTLWREAFLFGADFIFTIGQRYKLQASDTTKTANQIPPLMIRWKLFKFIVGIALHILIGNVPLKATLKNLTLIYRINLKVGKGKRIFANL